MSFADCDFSAIGCHKRQGSAPRPLAAIDAVYCMSLREQPRRTQAALAHLEAAGLADQTILYRPARGRHPPLEIWGGHRALARHALARGFRRVLILEDDARLLIPAELLQERIARANERLPKGWFGLYLGHFPLQAYPVAASLWRTRSGGTHAYVANFPLLEWMATVEPMDPAVRVCSSIGASIDAALANLPHMYALFPMVAKVVEVEDRRPDCVRTSRGRAAILTKLWWRETMMFRGWRFVEIAALLLSPWHALTLDYFCLKSGRALAQQALRLRAANGFDAAAYLAAYPDVAEAGMEPLNHYLRHGIKEGRHPAPRYDLRSTGVSAQQATKPI